MENKKVQKQGTNGYLQLWKNQEAIVNEQKQTSIADDVQNIHKAISQVTETAQFFDLIKRIYSTI